MTSTASEIPEMGSGCASNAWDRPPVPAWFAYAQALHNLPPIVRYCLATLLVVLTLLLRITLVADAPGYHFIFFIPAVIISSLFLAKGSGILAVLLSAALLKAFFLPEGFSFRFDRPEDFWALAVFLTTGLVTAFTGEALHQAFFQIAETNSQLTAAFRRIATSEHEKEVLLHEVAHRFKNDLTNLTSILRLQARNVTDPAARTELMAASERVLVMGRVHQRLARFGEVAIVDIREFITELCEDLRTAMIGSRPITLQADVQAGALPLPQAITIGMIINELVTNALKYAFPDGRTGQVAVSLAHDGIEHRLVVSDDGIGQAGPVPAGTGLGQRLVRSMAQQLGGTYEAQVTVTGRTCLVHFVHPDPNTKG